MIERDTTRYPIDAEAVGRAMYNLCVGFNEVFAQVADTVSKLAHTINGSLTEECMALIWATENAPRLYYLAEHARTQRARKKNKKRIIALYRSR